jgi:AAA domain
MPPSIVRQAPPRVEAEFPSDSVLASCVPVSTLREQHARLCIYGRNRSGKTTLACKFKKPILLVSAEPDENGGATSVSDVEGVFINRIAPPNKRIRGDKVHGSAKLVTIANELAAKNPFGTVVLDTVTSLQDIVLVELMGLPKVPEMMSWGIVPDGMYQQRADKLRETLRPLLKLDNCNVVVLAQEKDHNAQEDRGGRTKILHTMQQGSFMAPALGATNAQWLQDACGYVVQLYDDEVMQEIAVPMNNPDGSAAPPSIQTVGTGRRQRHLRLLYHPNFAAGGRWTYRSDMPEYVTAPTPDGLYEAMAQYIPALR